MIKNAAMKYLKKLFAYIRCLLSQDYQVYKKFCWAKKSLLSDDLFTKEEKSMINEVSLKIHPQDAMYTSSSTRHYLHTGILAMRIINDSLNICERQNSVKRILDFGCGYGRVMRYLRLLYPRADITGVEKDAAALNFSCNIFSAHPVLSNEAFDDVSIYGEFDLIWSGSLLTHLPKELIQKALTIFYRHLAKPGVCIVSAHGDHAINRLKEGKDKYNLVSEERDRIIKNYYEAGYSYKSDYNIAAGNGISFISYEKIKTLIEKNGKLSLTHFKSHGWDEHQDIYVLTAK